MATFTAKYSGKCGSCSTPIEPGDEVCYVDDVLVHEDCEGLAMAGARRPAPVCSTCFMLKPCPCEDGQ